MDEQYGDPRKCPTHGTTVSSPDGMHDSECGQCEAESEQMWDDEPAGSFDLSDDAEALASAGMGTDEDYGPLCDPEWECRFEE